MAEALRINGSGVTMAVAERRDNQTAFSSAREPAGVIAVNSSGASGIVLQSANGTEHVLWFRDSGALFHGTYANFQTPEAAGNAV